MSVSRSCDSFPVLYGRISIWICPPDQTTTRLLWCKCSLKKYSIELSACGMSCLLSVRCNICTKIEGRIFFQDIRRPRTATSTKKSWTAVSVYRMLMINWSVGTNIPKSSEQPSGTARPRKRRMFAAINAEGLLQARAPTALHLPPEGFSVYKLAKSLKQQLATLPSMYSKLSFRGGFAAVTALLSLSSLPASAQCPDYTTFSQVVILRTYRG